jgi:hypothetical protein
MLNQNDELTDEVVQLEITPKGRAWLDEYTAIAEASARVYLRWLDSLIVGEDVEL